MIAPNPNGHDEALADGDKLLALDSHNRLSALNTNESYIVKAPAGAGKTELLTQRVLALLATVDEPEEIVALTFTNKAAAEMRDRVVSSLRRSASGQPPVEAHKITTYELGRKVLERDAARQWHLLEHAGRLQITTIDALCGQLARQMPLMARMGS
ncbi:MAG: UvrD-helicase domain-containing protein, partial [Betaproteobacteria bacterium]